MALESSKQARELVSRNRRQNQQQMRAYREMSAEELFGVAWVRVRIGAEDLPGFKGRAWRARSVAKASASAANWKWMDERCAGPARAGATMKRYHITDQIVD